MPVRESQPETRLLVDHLFRSRAGQMVAWLTRIFGPAHIDLAEEVVQDALVKALQQWPYSGVPDNPSAWLVAVARNRALDVLRRHTAFAARAEAVAAEITRSAARPDLDRHAVEDDELRLVFMCCHPSLSPDARVALSLKTVGGFSVHEIARAFLVSSSAIAQRLVRAKRQVRDLDLTLDLPHASALGPRLASVLEVIYLMFNEGYAAHVGEALIRGDLCREALRLGRLVAGAPQTTAPEAHALAALMAFQAARLPARVGDDGEMVLLEDQDRNRWDAGLMALGFAHFERSAEGPRMTTYHAQAAIASVHARSTSAQGTDWALILELYDDLLWLAPSPVTALNRAVALSRVHGPLAALTDIAPLEQEPLLADYYLLPAVKARLLSELGDHAGAARCYQAALERPCNEPERRFLTRRLALAERRG
jgi:RNA polymerase sigma-70 factor, ECF subfamily